MVYVKQYSKVKDEKLKDFCDWLSSPQSGKKLNNFLMKDLIIDSETDEIIYQGTGVYFFKDDNNKIVYVGKASSKSFTERISCHFDPRKNAWFNYLLKYYAEINGNNNDSFKIEARDAYEKLSLILINFDADFDKIGKLEGLMRSCLDVMNKTKRGIQPEKLNNTIKDLIH